MNRRDFLQRDGWWVVAQNALTLAVLALGLVFRGQWHRTATIVVGVALLGLGGSFGVAGAWALGRNLTPYPKPRDRSTLVTHGVYGIVRHPLYSSLICASFGWALFWASWVALAASAALTWVLHAKARREERWLRERYADYRDYERRVKRFVPGVW